MRPAASASSGWLTVATKSWRRSATTQPSALVRPGRAGISTFGMPSSRASAAACSGPAPPKANSAKSRGSWPRARLTMRIAPAILSLATRTIAAPPRSRRGRAARRPARAARPRSSSIDTRVLDGEQPVRVEPAEDDVGVGDRRPGAAAAVADRPRRRARALRADAQHPRGVDRGDRAAAGADRVDVDHRHVDRHRVLELEVARDRRLAAEHEGDVARRAAHVVGDDVGELARRATRPASPSPRRRSRPRPGRTSRSRPRARRRSRPTPCRRCPA